MQVSRDVGKSPKLQSVAQEVAGLTGQCVGCTECRGVCQELLDALTLPRVVLSRPA